jgi:hypothetical protein
MIEPRLARIFERGDLEEARVIADLKGKGIPTSSQQREIVDDTGHIRGHIDGCVTEVPGAEKTIHLLEVKTMNASRYKQYKKNGLARNFRAYWAQIHLYMGYLKISRCLYVVTNKDNEERSYDRIHFDEDTFKDYKRVGMDIVTSSAAPPRIGDPHWLTCKTCSALDICHKGASASRSCRTCRNVEMQLGGKWFCKKIKIELTTNDQVVNCSDYELDEIFDV